MIKRICTVALILSLFCAAVFFVPTYASPEINVTANGERVAFGDRHPAIIDGRTLVPIREVFEHLGFVVSWNAETQTVTLVRGDDSVILIIGNPEFSANGEIYGLEVPAQIIDGRTMLPLRAVLESVGYFVAWNAETNTVVISDMPLPEIDAEPQAVMPAIPNRRLTDTEVAEWIQAYHIAGAPHTIEFELEVIRLTNIEREQNGLSPLEEHHSLMMAARFKSQSMYDLDYFAHESPVYGHFANIAREIFEVSPRAMGENLASGHRTPEEVLEGWMESPGHRDNILNPEYTYIGVGFYNFRWTLKLMN